MRLPNPHKKVEPVIEYSDVRYLLSKKSVDDRALNRTVLDALTRAMKQANNPRPSILEIGAGAGTMLPRLVEWGVLHAANYTLLDRDPEALEGARKHLASSSVPTADFSVDFVRADAFAFLADSAQAHRYDLIIANAVLDLMQLEPSLPRILRGSKSGGLYWFSINFDGETIFLPENSLDQRVSSLYHKTMDERVLDGVPCGDSKCGRHLLQLLPKLGAPLLAAGSSDWVVFPERDGYVQDEAYFLHHIVNTIDVALTGAAELDADQFADWVRLRHQQIEQGELIYIAHQIDVCGRAP